jgi:hypothetical protein
VVVSLHAGREYAAGPSRWQREASAALAGAGADLVIGNHAHRVQRPEWLRTADGRRVLVSYCQGNLVSHQARMVGPRDFDHPRAVRGDSFLLHVYVDRLLRPVSAAVTPLWTLRHGGDGAVRYRVVVPIVEAFRPAAVPWGPLLLARRERIRAVLSGFPLEERPRNTCVTEVRPVRLPRSG